MSTLNGFINETLTNRSAMNATHTAGYFNSSSKTSKIKVDKLPKFFEEPLKVNINAN